MSYIIIKNLRNKTISVNLMGYFRLFIQKYTDNAYFHFTVLHGKYDTIYSSSVKIIQSLENKNIIDEFNNKYKDFTIELSDTFVF